MSATLDTLQQNDTAKGSVIIPMFDYVELLETVSKSNINKTKAKKKKATSEMNRVIKACNVMRKINMPQQQNQNNNNVEKKTSLDNTGRPVETKLVVGRTVGGSEIPYETQARPSRRCLSNATSKRHVPESQQHLSPALQQNPIKQQSKTPIMNLPKIPKKTTISVEIQATRREQQMDEPRDTPPYRGYYKHKLRWITDRQFDDLVLKVLGTDRYKSTLSRTDKRRREDYASDELDFHLEKAVKKVVHNYNKRFRS